MFGKLPDWLYVTTPQNWTFIIQVDSLLRENCVSLRGFLKLRKYLCKRIDITDYLTHHTPTKGLVIEFISATSGYIVKVW